jgi:2-polyprenyl-3-methyl-5-hydroxy-6-metoxy-1,4-benzoquinol methylase
MKKEVTRDFDAASAGWDEEPRRVQLAQDIAAAICRELPLAPEMDALDYGCGTGLLTLALQPYVGSITGADSSQGMLEVLRRKLSERGVSNVSTNFIDLEQRETLQGRYDLIASSMTLHHMQDVEAAVGTFVEALNPGGWLALADLETEDGAFHDDLTGVHHHGFSRELFHSLFSKHGLSEIRIVTAATIEKPDREGRTRAYTVLLALARKKP